MPKSRRSGRRNAAVLRARELRRNTSLPEGLLWQILRTRPGNLKWRRQHPFEHCTADFYCPAAKLVVEVDGDHHSMGDKPDADARRDVGLIIEGLRVLRFDAAEVLEGRGVSDYGNTPRGSQLATPPPPFGWSPSPSVRWGGNLAIHPVSAAFARSV